MSRKQPFLLDSDVFIAAKNSYYAFAICPGFWKSLIHHHEKKRVFSIDQVRREILAGRGTKTSCNGPKMSRRRSSFWRQILK